MTQQIFCGNNLDLLKNYPDNHFDAIVTDPPYGLGKEPDAAQMLQAWITEGYLEVNGRGFMGKEWDAFVPQPIFWKEVFRGLKHGGHVVSFFGTRTYDWGVMAMRLAGFEVRDCIQWIYGSGFPKSHNISKAIDKMGGQSLDWFIDYVLQVADEKGITKKDLTMLFPSKNGKPTGWLWNKQNNQSITLEQYNKIKDYLNLPFENIQEAEREVIGKGKAGLTKGNISNFSGETEFDITIPNTDQAKQWDGWGTALKPANEPIVLARKPLEKGLSIAENVLKWGTGGINIDGCRIGHNEEQKFTNREQRKEVWNMNNCGFDNTKNDIASASQNGRFPANLILTHHPECECKGLKKVKPSNGSGKASENGGGFSKGMFGDGTSDNIGGGFTDENGEETVENWNCHEDCPIKIMDEQSGILKSGKMKQYINGGKYNVYGKMYPRNVETIGDSGGASRFFYCAKASKSERNKGLNGFESKQSELIGQLNNSVRKNGTIRITPEAKQNFHPTVKPVALMRYLVRLITPPNGIVLDPFNGSGTTGVACKLENFNYVGLELDAEYCKIAETRILGAIETDYKDEMIVAADDAKNETDNSAESQLSLF